MSKRVFLLSFLILITVSVGLSFSVWVSWEGEDWYRMIAKAYTEATQTPVEIVPIPAPDQKLLVALKTPDTLPDLCLIKSDDFPLAATIALPIDLPRLPQYADRFAQIGIQTYTSGGALRAVPFYADTQVLFLQTAVFEKYRIPLPEPDWNIGDFEALLAHLRAEGVMPIGWGFNSPYIFQGLQEGFGQSFLPDGTIRVITEENTRLLKRMRSWVTNGWFKDYPQRPGLVKDFSAGKVAMMPQGSYLIPDLDEMGVPYALAPLPEPWRSVIDTKAWVIFKNETLVYPFLSFLFERMEGLCATYAKQSLIEGIPFSGSAGGVLERALENGLVQPSTRAYSEGYWTAMKACLELYLRGEGELQELLSTAQAYIDQFQ